MDVSQVLERARDRDPSEPRRTFRLNRKRAVSKLREFALADPHHFVLELIQGAVANGARFIDIEASSSAFVMMYTGGSLGEHEVGGLFDFLFASKDDLGVAHLRQLALGINALFVFEPEEIVLESGDGTPSGTMRMTIRQGGECIDLGRSSTPLLSAAVCKSQTTPQSESGESGKSSGQGTIIAAWGLKRRAVRKRTALSVHPLGPRELSAVEERCLCSPIPIIVNGEALFGYRAMRAPRLYGYWPERPIDEGDLYGTIGIDAKGRQAVFRLLTYGVWIESLQHMLVDGVPISGIVNFDRLRKTVDHGAIVQDEMVAELWARLLPYGQQMAMPGTQTLHDIRLLSGEIIPAGRLVSWLRDAGTVIVAPLEDLSSDARGRAEAIATHLNAGVVRLRGSQLEHLKQVAGSSTQVLAPNLENDDDVRFYAQPEIEPPPPPYMGAPVSIVDLDTSKVLEQAGVPAWLLGSGLIEATLFATEGPTISTGSWARVSMMGRLLWQGPVNGGFDGVWLEVRLPPVLGLGLARNFASAVAQAVLRLSGAFLDELRERVLAAILRCSEELTERQRRLGLEALAERSLIRLRSRKSELPTAGLSVSLLGGDPELLRLPLLETLAGERLSLSSLPELMHDTHGLIYAVVEGIGADLEGLDGFRILEVDAATEALLVAMLGSATYVRVDRREVLAEHRGVTCRDMAVGLRSYPDFPLLVEGVDPIGWGDGERRACLEDLVDQLVKLASGARSLATDEPAENRRQALMHLQWFAFGAHNDEDLGVDRLPLVPALSGWLTKKEIEASKQTRAVYGASLCHADFESLERTACSVSSKDPRRAQEEGSCDPSEDDGAHEESGKSLGAQAAPRGAVTLRASPFLFRLLHSRGLAAPALDFDLSNEEAQARGADRAMLARTSLRGDGFSGWVGLPADEEVVGGILVVGFDGRRLDSVGESLFVPGIVGSILLQKTFDEQLNTSVGTELHFAMDRLMGELCALASRGDGGARPLELALSYAERNLVFVRDELGIVHPTVKRPAARAALDIPVQRTAEGVVLTSWDMVRAFCSFGEGLRGEHLQEPLAGWVRRVLCEKNIVSPRESLKPALSSDEDCVLERLARLFDAMRPDVVDSGSTRIQLVSTRSSRNLYEKRGSVALVDKAWGSLIVALNEDDPLVKEVLGSGTYALGGASWRGAAARTRAVAWLLLAIYSGVRAFMMAMTDTDDMLFQSRVLQALADDELCSRVVPHNPDPR